MPHSPLIQSGGLAAHTAMRLGADADGITKAAQILRRGGLVGFPTETVYGLGADATDSRAIARLYAAKGRPHFNPLIAHVADIEAALALGVFNDAARTLAMAFWPGPLTLVVPAAANCPVCELARAGLISLAIRVPDHAIARAILREAARPIAAPSANRSGHISPTLAAHVREDLEGVIEAIVEGGASIIGVESTILSCLGNEVRLLRPGGISRDDIERILGITVLSEVSEAAGAAEPMLIAPGQMASHYAPRATLRLDAHRVMPGESCLGFGLPLPEGASATHSLNLSGAGDLTEAAANLYHHLRALDAMGNPGICVAPIPAGGIGEAIHDRLKRAAAPREMP